MTVQDEVMNEKFDYDSSYDLDNSDLPLDYQMHSMNLIMTCFYVLKY